MRQETIYTPQQIKQKYLLDLEEFSIPHMELSNLLFQNVVEVNGRYVLYNVMAHPNPESGSVPEIRILGYTNLEGYVCEDGFKKVNCERISQSDLKFVEKMVGFDAKMNSFEDISDIIFDDN